MGEAFQRTVVVTGGSRGIGRAVCLAFAAPGTAIILGYRQDAAAAGQTAEECRARGASMVAAVAADVCDPEAVTDLFERATVDTGRLDVLVCNAGITRDGLILRMREAAWDAVITTNLTGAFYCTRAAARIMIRQHRGRIILISSVVAATGNAGQTNYTAAKAGILGLTKSLARELASRQITVNAVAPGLVDTEMTAAMTADARDAALKNVPLGRLGRVEEIAAAVMYLASEEAGYITGQTLHVNGGMYM
jgi:3-oxoacyl-[acyl-carrier protein] reductase